MTVEFGGHSSSQAKEQNFGLPELQSSRSSHRLEQVAALRARGIGDHIDLPQLVVCGDQSAGKSSVLEGLTGIPFPRQEGVCTKFPTEIILEHTDEPRSIAATILPCASRDESTKTELLGYKRDLETFAELPKVIVEVGSLMGIRGFGPAPAGPAFAEDVLRVKVSGPTGLHLTVVDLPGLFSVPNQDQTEDDMQKVHDMVNSYASNSRTIILAVVQAGNDIANQSIIQKSRHFDKAGQRTVGIITKPDLINEGSEKRIARLARNEDTTKLKLGFFLLKNSSPTETANGIRVEQRQQNEIRFFQSSPWKEQSLSADRVGIISLGTFLQNLLDQHIERELPKVRQEIRMLMQKTEQQLLAMGDERSSTSHLRIFLSRLSMRFHNLVVAGLHGNYHEADAEFFDGNGNDSNPLRLRALVHKLNTQFSDYLRENGQKRKYVAQVDPRESEPEELPEQEPILVDEQNQMGVHEKDQILVSRDEMKIWVKEIYMNSRGRELPGNYNHVLLSELFHIQSSRWQGIAQDHVAKVCDQITFFINAALRHVTNDDNLFNELVELVEPSTARARVAANEELRDLWEDEKQQPITYNHYYTDNVQNSRHNTAKALMKKAMKEASVEEYHGKMHISNNRVDAEKLLASLQRRVIVNMDEQACTEALAGLEAYYKVARKTFVDNICKQVVERHLLRKLPENFCPESVASIENDDLKRIAAEPPGNMEKRKVLRELYGSLECSLQDLCK